MSEIIRQYNIYINSSQMLKIGKSSYVILLPAPITLNGISPSIFKVFIDRAQIPFSWSQFSSIARNVQCEFILTRNSINYSGSFSITDGNYNILSLANEFLNKLRQECNTLSGYEPPLTFSYSEDTNHLQFFLQPDLISTFITISNTNFKGLNTALGFSNSWVIDDTFPYTESTEDCNVSPSRSLYITSTTLQQFQSWSAITTPFQTNSILTQIPIQRTPLLFITHSPNYPIKTTLTNSSISEIEIGIRDEQLNELEDFQLSFSFHLVIEEVKLEPYLISSLDMIREKDISNDEVERRQKLLDEYRKEQEEALDRMKTIEQQRLDRLLNKIKK